MKVISISSGWQLGWMWVTELRFVENLAAPLLAKRCCDYYQSNSVALPLGADWVIWMLAGFCDL